MPHWKSIHIERFRRLEGLRLDDLGTVNLLVPDNEAPGTLEDLLLEAGALAYPELQRAATDYVQGIDHVQGLSTQDLAGFGKPAGRKKATIAAMAGILKPGKAIQVSIQDNDWLNAASIQLPKIKEANRFIQELLS
jgi:hypothetical protein